MTITEFRFRLAAGRFSDLVSDRPEERAGPDLPVLRGLRRVGRVLRRHAAHLRRLRVSPSARWVRPSGSFQQPEANAGVLLLQEPAARLPVQDPDEPERVAAAAEPGVPAGRLAGGAGPQPGAVHGGGRPAALLPAHLLQLDGPGVRPHVHRPGEGLQHLRPPIHPQVLRRGLG